ncbi:MAG TPA: Tad domain-containing protein [Herpetosiphonaceae bacterium]|nr:Tad domain-containing protein [Herpetosiphonaceae bacterium]
MKRSAHVHSGQAIVLVAVFAVTLLAFLGLATDTGMLYVERRHLQNTVDAACLAAATDMAMGQDWTTAQETAFAYIDNNLGANANLAFDLASLDPDVPPPTDGDIRVTVRVRAFSYFMRLVGIETYNVMARARCGITQGGGLSPIAVNRYPGYDTTGTKFRPGVNTGLTLPQYYRRNKAYLVRDVLEAADNANLTGPNDATFNRGGPLVSGCDSDYRNWNDWPSLGAPGDPDAGIAPTGPYRTSCPEATEANPGPDIVIAGKGAIPSNGNPSFTGPVMLDVRRVSSGPDYYNGVSPDTALSVYKDLIAQYILTDYPGPSIPTGEQLGIVPGVSAGIIVDALNDRYDYDDEISVLIYDGTIRKKGDFQLSVTCKQEQAPYPTGTNASCDNTGTNAGKFVYRKVPPATSTSSFFDNECRYKGEFYAADTSYAEFSGTNVRVRSDNLLYPATYVVKLEPVAGNAATVTLPIRLRARISGANPGAGADFGATAVRWKTLAGATLTGWQSPLTPVDVSLPANTTVELLLEVIQTQYDTVSCTSTTTGTINVRVPKHVYGAQRVQVDALSTDTGTRHGVFGTLGMYETNTGNPYQSGDYFLSFSGDTVVAAAPGDTVETPLMFVDANSNNALGFSQLPATGSPSMTLSISPTLTLSGAGIVSAQGDPALQISLPADAAPGWYTAQFQWNSTPAHSVRFQLLVVNPANPSVDEWVTALCYATFKITSHDDPNFVKARAITGCQSLDEAVGGWTSRLLPWDE